MTDIKTNAMKKLLPLILLITALNVHAQVPQQINYQGIARNSVGSVIANQNITLRLSIREGSASGLTVYRESRTLRTNSFGLFVTAIGSSGATNVSGLFSDINWGAGTKFLQVEIDPTGGSGFIDMGTSQLLSVPYAIYANKAGSALPSGIAGGDLTGNYPVPLIRDGAITNSKIGDGEITASKLETGLIPTSLPPNGTAGGDLVGTYPNPTIRQGIITGNKIATGTITADKLAPGVIPSALPMNGTAGGDLTGTYPNPLINNGAVNNSKLADNSVSTVKVQDGSITSVKLATGVIPTSLPPNGTAGGDLTGAYPNPILATGVVDNTKLADNSISTVKVQDGAITASKLDPSLFNAATGAAGGDLSGTYPNPTIANSAITTNKLADNSVTTLKIADGSITSSKLANNSVTSSNIVDASVTVSKMAAGVIPTSLPPNGNAGGDLSGTYPNPLVTNNAITSQKLADGSVTNTKIGDNEISTSKIQDGAITASKLDPSLLIASGGGSPTGAAGGDLSGTYPNPIVNKIQGVTVGNTVPANGQVLKFNGTAWVPSADNIGSFGSNAGGDLSGTYPDPNIASGAVTTPKIANGAINTPKIQDGAVTYSKLNTAGATTGQVLKFDGTNWGPGTDNVGSGGSPSGAAGGDLTGTYPNPTINANTITTTKLADNSVTTLKVVDGSITSTKLATGVIPTSLPPNGAAGGDLTGTYPNPVIANNAVNTTKIADNSITTLKVADGSITNSKLASGVIPTSLPPNGTAGGDLSGSYPNPIVNKLQGVTVSNTAPVSGQVLKFNGTTWVPGADDTGTGSLTGPAGGDLTGSYPNPTIGSGAVNNTKLADNSVSTLKLQDASVTSIKLAAGVIPTSLPPNGSAGGDLTGTYPNPVVANNAITSTKIADNSITTLKIADASVTSAKLANGIIPTSLPPNGSAGGDLSGSYPNPTVNKIQGVGVSNTVPTTGQVLTFNGTQWTASTPSGGAGLSLPYNSTVNSASNLFSLTNSGTGSGVEGINSSMSSNVSGVIGQITSATPGTMSTGVKGINNGTGTNGIGVYGLHSGNGYGVYGNSVGGTGVYGNSASGFGVMGTSTTGTAIYGQSTSGNAGSFYISDATNSNDAVFISNFGDGNALKAESEKSNGILATTNSPSYAAIQAFNNGGGVGIWGITFGTGSAIKATSIVEGGTALEAGLDASTGDIAVFKGAGDNNKARIDATGKGFFNGGTQNSGADVAETFDVEGNRNEYEPGDVLIISQSSDRTVEKSQSPYSTLVAGVYATKPGLILTERNATEDQLDEMVPMGVIGVIPTKVCMEGGTIKRGDLLVTSSISGVAMKADPDKVKVGQVIGKALEDYNTNGVGKIKVLVSIK